MWTRSKESEYRELYQTLVEGNPDRLSSITLNNLNNFKTPLIRNLSQERQFDAIARILELPCMQVRELVYYTPHDVLAVCKSGYRTAGNQYASSCINMMSIVDAITHSKDISDNLLFNCLIKLMQLSNTAIQRSSVLSRISCIIASAVASGNEEFINNLLLYHSNNPSLIERESLSSIRKCIAMFRYDALVAKKDESTMALMLAGDESIFSDLTSINISLCQKEILVELVRAYAIMIAFRDRDSWHREWLLQNGITKQTMLEVLQSDRIIDLMRLGRLFTVAYVDLDTVHVAVDVDKEALRFLCANSDNTEFPPLFTQIESAWRSELRNRLRLWNDPLNIAISCSVGAAEPLIDMKQRPIVSASQRFSM